jgi:catechol 2,3-dioxygenase-like lactoylglutathione lyase family enzyme
VSVPPLLTVFPGASDPRVKVWPDGRCLAARAQAFGSILAASRERRGIPVHTLTIYSAQTPEPPNDQPQPGALWAPHIYRWDPDGEAALAWELGREPELEDALGAGADAIRRWASRPERLLDLAALAGPAAGGDQAHDGDERAQNEQQQGHLSLRWILANERAAAAALSSAQVGIEHVSLHVDPHEEARLVRALVDGLGLVEVARPASITTPGRWLQAGATRVHLNSRTARTEETGFPGTAPNHICFAVADPQAAAAAVQAAGFSIVRQGSLGNQTWWRLSSGTTIELQPIPSPR